MSAAELVDAISLCPEFPKAADDEILRDNLIDAIEGIFQTDTRVVVVTGEEGVGATTLLAQFIRRHSKKSACAFIRPWSRPALSPDYIRSVLATQISNILGEKDISTELVDETHYTQLATKIARYAARKGRIYFVVDGISEIPSEASFLRDVVLKELMPFGFENIYFLFSGKYEDFSQIHRNSKATSYQIPPLSYPESRQFLSNLALSEEAMREVYGLGRGYPGRLAVLKRMIGGGISFQSIVTQDLDNLPDFLALEWAQVAEASDACKTLIALLAFGKDPSSLRELSEIASLSEEAAREQLTSIKILRIDQETVAVGFLTESHRKFAAKKMAAKKKQTLELIVAALLKRGETKESVVLLPTYLDRAGNNEALVKFLSPGHFESLLNQTLSISTVRTQLDLGYMAAQKANLNLERIGFATQKSILHSAQAIRPWMSELKALIALGSYQSALELTSNTLAKESRLQLLASYARALRERNVQVDALVLKEIELLTKEIDFKELGETALDIACNIVVVDPELAIRLVRESAGDGGDSQEVDKAFLSLTAAAAMSKDASSARIASQKISAHINNKSTQKLSEAITSFFGNDSAEEVIEKTKKLEEKNRFYFLKQWIETCSPKERAIDVVSYALEAMVADTKYLPSMADLRVIAIPLAYSSELEKVKELIGRVEAQKGILKKLGSTEDLVRLEVLLARAQVKFDSVEAAERFRAVLELVLALTDLGVKVQCLAWVIVGIGDLSHVDELKKFSVADRGKKALLEALKALLEVTAEHFINARLPIYAFSRVDLDEALRIAEGLNTADRRNEAYQMIAWTRVDFALFGPNPQMLLSVVGRIDNLDTRDETIVGIVQKVSRLRKGYIAFEDMRATIRMLSQISNRNVVCQAIPMLVRACNTQFPEDVSLTDDLVLRFQDGARVATNVWDMVDAGFELVAALNTNVREEARRLFEELSKTKRGAPTQDESAERLIIATVLLAVRAFSGLVPLRKYTAHDVRLLEDAITLVPSEMGQVTCWSNWAIRVWALGDLDLSIKIVKEKLWPLIEGVNNSDTATICQLLEEAAPALACNGIQAVIEKVKGFPVDQRDELLGNVAKVHLRKLPGREPMQNGKFDFKPLYWPEILEIVAVMREISTDNILNDLLEDLTDALSSKKAKAWINESQRAELSASLLKLVDGKFPDARNITHDGFKIASLGYVYRLLPTDISKWKDLRTKSDGISNVSDRVMTIALFCSAMPSRHAQERRGWLKEAGDLVDTIPSALDRAGRFFTLANACSQDEPNMAQGFLRDAMRRSLDVESAADVSEVQRRILDLAHQIKPELAKELAKELDDDPARRQASRTAMQRLSALDIKKKLVSAQQVSWSGNDFDKALPQAAEMSLASLNVGRAEPLKLDALMQYFDLAKNGDFDDARPIYAWIVENAVRRLSSNEQQVNGILLPLYKALVTSTVFGARLTAVLVNKPAPVRVEMGEALASRVFGPDEREAALGYLRDWFSESVKTYLKISDPYFSPDDLEIVKILQAENSEIRVTVMAGNQHLRKIQGKSVQEAFAEKWKQISDIDPPDIEIILIGTDPDGVSPMHDRWWITEGAGLRIGTSANSIGAGRISEVVALDQEEINTREEAIDRYVERRMKMHGGRRLTYQAFTIG
jgi:hypothetical protein